MCPVFNEYQYAPGISRLVKQIHSGHKKRKTKKK